jgi:hypothetical protein
MPSSGKAEQAWEFSAYRWERIASALARGVVPWVYTEHYFDRSIGTVTRALIILLLIAIGIRYRRGLSGFVSDLSSQGEAAGRTLEFAGWLTASVVVLATWYALSSWAVHFYTRYMVPLSLVATFVLGCTAAYKYRRAPTVVAGSTVLLITPILVASVLLWHGGLVANGFFRHQLNLVERCVPTQETVAAGQSGTLAYFRDRVVNLDGKVNPRALDFQTRMWEYLPQVHAQWLCDWPYYIRAYLGEHPEKYGWKLVATEESFLLLHYDLPSAVRVETVRQPDPPSRAGLRLKSRPPRP